LGAWKVVCPVRKTSWTGPSFSRAGRPRRRGRRRCARRLPVVTRILAGGLAHDLGVEVLMAAAGTGKSFVSARSPTLGATATRTLARPTRAREPTAGASSGWRPTTSPPTSSPAKASPPATWRRG
jgi:hypothetical protein